MVIQAKTATSALRQRNDAKRIAYDRQRSDQLPQMRRLRAGVSPVCPSPWLRRATSRRTKILTVYRHHPPNVEHAGDLMGYQYLYGAQQSR
jgi:hypothetical protein